ncbi:hypothetical protein [Leptolyngbya sp. KIOST-1]|uniref:hypothetical protein n=1 Tax=Leptolyngbya sp. KIOST-1 TaxID=1229172 RepID=UPI0012E0A23E|nr:hypothetical protein [Leptolyngbya sp. KIOST-1]
MADPRYRRSPSPSGKSAWRCRVVPSLESRARSPVLLTRLVSSHTFIFSDPISSFPVFAVLSNGPGRSQVWSGRKALPAIAHSVPASYGQSHPFFGMFRAN